MRHPRLGRIVARHHAAGMTTPTVFGVVQALGASPAWLLPALAIHLAGVLALDRYRREDHRMWRAAGGRDVVVSPRGLALGVGG